MKLDRVCTECRNFFSIHISGMPPGTEFWVPEIWTCGSCQVKLAEPDPLDLDDDEYALRNAIG